MTAASVRKCLGLISASLAILMSSLGTSSCSPETLNSAMQDLNTLVQNKTLAEQFVRDIKASVDPSEPIYAKLLESYDQAKDCNSRFLDAIEGSGSYRSRAIRSSLEMAKRNAEESMVAFLDSATRTLRPTVSMRSTDLRRIAALPENFPMILRNVPQSTRAKYVRKFDSSVRWRSWTDL
jgi:hypothetical protein